MVGPNIPQEIKGFGRLGKFCNTILRTARAAIIQKIIIEEMTPGSPASSYADVQVLPSGTLIKVKLKSSSGAFGGDPFEVTVAKDPDTNLFVTSIGNGELINQFQKNDVAITGINDTVLDDTAVGDLVWLDVQFTGWDTVVSAIIDGGASTGWAGSVASFPEPFDFNSDPTTWDGSDPAPQQTHAYLLIAEMIDDGHGNPTPRQCVNTNLMLLPVAWFGLTASGIFPGFGST